jgi:hypothetical protein
VHAIAVCSGDQSGRSNSVRAIPTVLVIKDLLVDDGLEWASFTSKYPRPGPAGLMQTSLPPIHLPQTDPNRLMVRATSYEGSSSST